MDNVAISCQRERQCPAGSGRFGERRRAKKIQHFRNSDARLFHRCSTIQKNFVFDETTKKIALQKWNIGERFVVYLAIDDLMYGLVHLLDHGWMLAVQDNPPEIACELVGFVFQIFMVGQWLVIFFSAICACSLVVCNKKLRLGRWDWRLLVITFGCPALLSAIKVPLGILGPSGSWFVYLFCVSSSLG